MVFLKGPSKELPDVVIFFFFYVKGIHSTYVVCTVQNAYMYYNFILVY